MPYIKQEDRLCFDSSIEEIAEVVENEGDLNYIFTSLIHKRLENVGLKYQTVNNLIGMLECCKLELYRIIAAPYEDIKKQENGNVSECDVGI